MVLTQRKGKKPFLSTKERNGSCLLAYYCIVNFICNINIMLLVFNMETLLQCICPRLWLGCIFVYLWGYHVYALNISYKNKYCKKMCIAERQRPWSYLDVKWGMSLLIIEHHRSFIALHFIIWGIKLMKYIEVNEKRKHRKGCIISSKGHELSNILSLLRLWMV